MFKVAEIFDSFQMEGYYTGTYARFVRFAGCNLNCYFCDTHIDPKQVKEYTHEQLLEVVLKDLSANRVILTGGEPTIQQDLLDFIDVLANEVDISIETNGTQYGLLNEIKDTNYSTAGRTWITLSPKSEFKDIFTTFTAYDEVKLLWTLPDSILINWIKKANQEHKYIYIQPVTGLADISLSEQCQQILNFAKNLPNIKLSLQGHKFVNLC
jgi:7-carboxy-7-deazaguanine synthase